jgi:streptogramin lyase
VLALAAAAASAAALALAATVTLAAAFALTGALAGGDASAATLGAVTELSIQSAGAPAGIADGPEGNLWFIEYGLGYGEAIGRVTTAGQIAEFGIPTSGSGSRFITAGPDGNMWFTEYAANKIGRISPSGQITEFNLPSEGGPNGIAAGPDGNIWFTLTAADAIGRITPSGQISEFPLPDPGAGPVGIAQGPDGQMWFTEYGFGYGERIGSITTSGQISEFTVPGAGDAPYGIAPGADGHSMWFTENAADRIGRIELGSDQITSYPIPTSSARPLAIATGPDGNLWFTEFGEGLGQKIGRITPSGEVSEYQTLTGESGPEGIAAGPDGNMWFTEFSKGQIGQIGTGSSGAYLTSPSVSGNGWASFPQTCSAATFGSLNAEQPLDGLLGSDGFEWLLDGREAGRGDSFTPPFYSEGEQLTCTEFVTYPTPLLISDAVTSPPRTVIPPPPTLTRLHLASSSFSEGTKRQHPARKHRPAPVGEIVAFRLNELAPVTFTFDQRVSGRRVAGHCVAQTRKNSKRKSCLRTVSAGTLSLFGQQGANNVYFQGALGNQKLLKPGHYTLVVSSANTTGASPSSSIALTVIA